MTKARSTLLVVCGLALLYPFASLARNATEVLLSETENAYNPIPSPDGKLIAYVRTGWGQAGRTTGFGRSNLRSEIAVMDDLRQYPFTLPGRRRLSIRLDSRWP
jgi:hypothetical protein